MCNLKKTILAASLFMGVYQVGYAADANSGPGQAQSPMVTEQSMPVIAGKPNMTAEQIKEINERVSVLGAQLNELDLRLQISNKQDQIKKNKAGPVEPQNLPTVMEIEGIDGQYKATLYLEGGNTQSVRKGDKVGIWKIKDIKMDSVTVQQGKELVRLGFGSYIPQQQAQQTPLSMPLQNGMVPGIPQ